MPTNFVRPPAKRSAAHNPQTTSASTSGYRSDCKICGESIHDEPAQWLRDPMGLSHTDCIGTEATA